VSSLPLLPSRQGEGSGVAAGACASATTLSARLCCLARLFDTAGEAMELSLDATGLVESVNPSLFNRLGRPRALLIGQGLTTLLTESGQRWLAGLQPEGSPPEGPVVLQFLDEAGHPFSVRAVALRAAGRTLVTGLLSAEHELRQHEELHEVNNELAVNSRELARQRRQLEKLVGQARARQVELQTAYTAIERLARTDPLTGLANRRVLDEELPRMLDHARRTRRPVSALVLDLDHFKRVNDEFGHDAGDRVLADVAEALRLGIRENDLAVRMGGEELMVVLPGVGADRALALAEELRRRIADLRVASLGLSITVSIGVATWCDPEERLPELLARADAALYRAKGEGRNRCVLADDSRPLRKDGGPMTR
jgi:diguanylate cyclase (GGDEF)-like protein